ncbi:MAG: hypothetical protein R2710_26630 [Acidimicrobiales bacterium]
MNAEGDRFVDEERTSATYTYAKYGRHILEQPDSIAYQLFDATLRPMLRTEYDMPGISVEVADTIDELAERIGVPPEALHTTVEQFNASIDRDRPLDPTVKDGRRSRRRAAQRATGRPPSRSLRSAYPAHVPSRSPSVDFGETSTGGCSTRRVSPSRPLRLWRNAGRSLQSQPPGGSGLTAGMVFGRRAGSIA